LTQFKADPSDRVV